MKRQLFLVGSTFTLVELGLDAAILFGFFPLERDAALAGAISLAPVLALSTLFWLLVQGRWTRALGGELGPERAREAAVRYPRRALLYRSLAVGALGLALAPTLAGLVGLELSAAGAIVGTIASVGFATNVARAGVYRRLLAGPAQALFPGEALRYLARCLRERLFVSTVVVGAAGVAAAAVYIRFVVGVPVPDLSLAAVLAPAVIALTLGIYSAEMWRATVPLVSFLVRGPVPAPTALRVASNAPYRFAGSAFVGWAIAAVISALAHRARGAPGVEALQILAGVVAVGIGILPYQLSWHRRILEPVREAAAASLVASEGEPQRSRLSLRAKLVLAFGALVVFGGTFALLSARGEHDRFLAASAAAEAVQRRDAVLDAHGERLAAAAGNEQRLVALARDLSDGREPIVALADGRILGERPAPLPPRLAEAVRAGLPAYGPVPQLQASVAFGPAGPGAAIGVLKAWRDPGRRDVVPLLFVFAALAIASAGLVLVTVQELTGPLRALAQGARRVGQGDLARPIAPPDSDEMGELASAMEYARRELSAKIRSFEELNASLETRVRDRTADLEQANRELAAALAQLQAAKAEIVQAEKMASLGRLVAGIAHEINNPLNFVQNGLPPLKQAVDRLAGLVRLLPPAGADERTLLAAAKAASELRQREGLEANLADAEDLLRVMGNGVSRMGAIVRALRDFSRQSQADAAEPVDLERLVDDAAALLRHDFKDRIELAKDLAGLGAVTCQPGPMTQVFMNLLKNAAQAIPGRGTVRVSGRRLDGGVEVKVSDTGPGIPADALSKIFEPFFTTKPVGEGTGLGLAIVHGIVEKHGGRITCESQPGSGTHFTILLPQPGQPNRQAS